MTHSRYLHLKFVCRSIPNFDVSASASSAFPVEFEKAPYIIIQPAPASSPSLVAPLCVNHLCCISVRPLTVRRPVKDAA
jgi:hypothetical protein